MRQIPAGLPYAGFWEAAHDLGPEPARARVCNEEARAFEESQAEFREEVRARREKRRRG